MFVSEAFAQGEGAAAGPEGLVAFLPIVLIFVVFYFLLIRPQQKKLKEHKEMLNAIRRGDRVVTGGGIIGTVTKVVDDNEIMVEIAEGIRVRVQRGLISGVLAKTQPAGDTRETREPRETADSGEGNGAPGGPAEGTGNGSSKGARLKRVLGNKSN